MCVCVCRFFSLSLGDDDGAEKKEWGGGMGRLL